MSAGKTVPIDTRPSCSESDTHQRCSGMTGTSNPSSLRMLKKAFVYGNPQASPPHQFRSNPLKTTLQQGTACCAHPSVVFPFLRMNTVPVPLRLESPRGTCGHARGKKHAKGRQAKRSIFAPRPLHPLHRECTSSKLRPVSCHAPSKPFRQKKIAAIAVRLSLHASPQRVWATRIKKNLFSFIPMHPPILTAEACRRRLWGVWPQLKANWTRTPG